MQTQTTTPTLPPTVKVQDVITLTARLAQLLAEEVDLLSEMKVSKIEALQQEKLFLVSALDAQRKLIDRHPHLLDTIPSQDKKDLQEVVEVFNTILEENHRKLLLAKEVNHRIVQAITAVVKESTQSKVYDGKGYTGAAAFETVSVTLNKTV
jgi:flagellar biosynthesis/type III secretory pathway chaperone